MTRPSPERIAEIKTEMMVGALLPLGMITPVLFGFWIWSLLGKTGIASVVAILVGASALVAMKGIYAYFAFRLTEKQSVEKIEHRAARR